MKKFLSIALSTVLMLSILSLSAFAKDEPVKEGIIDFETEYAALDTFYFTITEESNGNHYAKINAVNYDDGFDPCHRVPFKPLGDIEKYYFTEDSKWVYKCDFHLDIQKYGDKAVAVYIGTSRTNVNSQNLNDPANPVFYAPSHNSLDATAFPAEWQPIENMHDGWNSFELDLTMGPDGSAVFNILINGVMIHEECEVPEFLSDNAFDGLCFAAIHPDYARSGANIGIDNIYFACLDEGDAPEIPDETEPQTQQTEFTTDDEVTTDDEGTTADDAGTTAVTTESTDDVETDDKDSSWIIIAAIVAVLIIATVVAVVVINKKKK